MRCLANSISLIGRFALNCCSLIAIALQVELNQRKAFKYNTYLPTGGLSTLAKQAWDDVFTDPYVLDLSDGIYNATNSFTTGSNLYVTNSIFLDCISTIHGGAILCNHDNALMKMLIEESSFIRCGSTFAHGAGGAICFIMNGQCALSKICGCKCYSANQYQFSNIMTTQEGNSINSLNDSTIISNGEGTINMNFFGGAIKISSTNVSQNNCSSTSGAYLSPMATEVQLDIISYSTFANNTANVEYSCIRIDQSDMKLQIRSCNIIGNVQPIAYDNGIIESYSDLCIRDSYIFANIGKYIIVESTSSSRTATIINCTMEDDISISGSINITETPIAPFINALNHYSTQICFADFEFTSETTTTTTAEETSSSTTEDISSSTTTEESSTIDIPPDNNEEPPSKDDSPKTGMIVGIVIGVLLFIIIVVGIIIYIMKMKENPSKDDNENPEEMKDI